jgi:hypothetical protein
MWCGRTSRTVLQDFVSILTDAVLLPACVTERRWRSD